MPKVSIIVPVYNVEKYLAKCIDSIIAQEYDDWELILVNDGSSDSSKAICEEYCIKDNRISLYNQGNAGPSAARNLGIKKAKGEYITFIDSDDYVTPTYLMDLVKYDSDIIASGFDLWYFNGKPTERKTYDKLGTYSLTDNNIGEAIAIGEYKYLWHSPCCKLYYRELLISNNLLFNEKLNYGEDHLFNLTVLLHCTRITLVPVSNYIYTHYGNLSLTNRRVPYETMIKYIILLNDIWRKTINNHNIVDNQYINFHNTQITLLYWQSVYTLYIHSKSMKNIKSYLKNNLRIIGADIIYNKCKLPRTYRILQFMSQRNFIFFHITALLLSLNKT